MLYIGEFSKISNVTTKALRYYDEIGLLKPVHVNSENGYRYYDVAQLKTVLLIARLKLYGFSLDEIAEVLCRPSDCELLSSLLAQKRNVMEGALQHCQFVLAQLAQDCESLERGIPIMSYLDTIPVKLVETPTLNLLSIRKKMNVNDYSKYLGELYQKMQKENLTPTGAPMAIYHDVVFDPENYDMEVAIPVKEAVTGTREMKGGLCATACLKGPYTGLTSLYAKINEWVEAEGYTPVGLAYDVYQTDPSETPPDENVTEVYFPVRK